MDIDYNGVKPINVPLLLRKAGYHSIFDFRGGHESWVRNLAAAHYPRFHLYATVSNPKAFRLDLHLDQKQATIQLKGMSRHSGEYDGAVVEEEIGRIKRWLQYAQQGGRL